MIKDIESMVKKDEKEKRLISSLNLLSTMCASPIFIAQLVGNSKT